MTNSPAKKKRNWRKILSEKMVDSLVNICYLAIVFSVFTWYRRIILAGYDIEYTNYWVALIKALMLAKVIKLGFVFRLGRGLGHKPLIYPTLYKTVVFTLFAAAFTLMEHMIRGLWLGKGLTGGIAAYFEKGPHDIVAGSLMVFVAFIPFFGVKELGRVLGEEKITALFFKRRDTGVPDSEKTLNAV